MHRAGAGAQLSPYSEWEQAEQQRMSRISRMRPSGNPFDERQPQEEVVLVGPEEEGDGGGMEAVGATPDGAWTVCERTLSPDPLTGKLVPAGQLECVPARRCAAGRRR